MDFFQRTLSTMLFLWPLLEFKTVDRKTFLMDFFYMYCLKKVAKYPVKICVVPKIKKTESKTTSLHILIGNVYPAWGGMLHTVPRVQVKRRPSAARFLPAPTQMALCLRLAYIDL